MRKYLRIEPWARHLCTTIAPLTRKIWQSKASTKPYNCGHHLAFIVGPPRTGSTVLYQMLTYSLDCLYINNFVSSMYADLPLGFWLSNILHGNSRNHDFDSNYGVTDLATAPSESGAFWFRWFPREKDVVKLSELSNTARRELTMELDFLMHRYQKNILFKNLNCSMRITALTSMFPEAKYIRLKRDPYFSVQSMLLAREKLGIPDHSWWSVKPSNYETLIQLPLVERLAAQVYFIEEQISSDLKNQPSESSLTVDYENIGRDWNEIVRFLGWPVLSVIDVDTFEFKNKVSVPAPLEFLIRDSIAKYDWQDL